MIETLLISGITALFTGGVVWGTLKTTVNGTVERVVKIETHVTNIEKQVYEVAKDVAFIKGVQHQEGLDREAAKR